MRSTVRSPCVLRTLQQLRIAPRHSSRRLLQLSCTRGHWSLAPVAGVRCSPGAAQVIRDA